MLYQGVVVAVNEENLQIQNEFRNQYQLNNNQYKNESFDFEAQFSDEKNKRLIASRENYNVSIIDVGDDSFEFQDKNYNLNETIVIKADEVVLFNQN